VADRPSIPSILNFLKQVTRGDVFHFPSTWEEGKKGERQRAKKRRCRSTADSAASSMSGGGLHYLLLQGRKEAGREEK